MVAELIKIQAAQFSSILQAEAARTEESVSYP